MQYKLYTYIILYFYFLVQSLIFQKKTPGRQCIAQGTGSLNPIDF